VPELGRYRQNGLRVRVTRHGTPARSDSVVTPRWITRTVQSAGSCIAYLVISAVPVGGPGQIRRHGDSYGRAGGRGPARGGTGAAPRHLRTPGNPADRLHIEAELDHFPAQPRLTLGLPRGDGPPSSLDTASTNAPASPRT
jgi:hypothetical protein